MDTNDILRYIYNKEVGNLRNSNPELFEYMHLNAVIYTDNINIFSIVLNRTHRFLDNIILYYILKWSRPSIRNQYMLMAQRNFII